MVLHEHPTFPSALVHEYMPLTPSLINIFLGNVQIYIDKGRYIETAVPAKHLLTGNNLHVRAIIRNLGGQHVAPMPYTFA